ILRGRWGPYVTDGVHNARVPKDEAPEGLTLEACHALLEATAQNSTSGSRKKTTGKKTTGKKTTGKKTTRKKTTGKKKTRKKTTGKTTVIASK
ncbi:MAG: topoisomerase C-terminal repeat-containing protein, partial [Pseudomonadota bacterium]|nr:topoisomerase C-terminal repeat-containing protein [Pseudomonadota bacterium]